MSTITIAMIHASAEFPKLPADMFDRAPEQDSPIPADPVEAGATEDGPATRDPAQVADAAGTSAVPVTPAPGPDPDLWLYRDRTVALLRRYMRLSIEVGRMPSLLGREFFRTRVTSYKASTFEDSVIFVHDVERSLEKLDEFQKQLIARIVLQEYSQEEAGSLLGCGLRHAARSYLEALDRVSEIFLKRELLTRFPGAKLAPQKSCQGGQIDEFFVSDSEETNKF